MSTDPTYARGRLERELREIVQNPPTHISFGPLSDGDVFKLEGIIMGPISTPYEGGIFHLSLEFPSDYPFCPPEVKFLTKIYHPNVNEEDGTINLNILGEQWTPALTTETLLLSISSMLFDPIFPFISPVDPSLHSEVAQHSTSAFPDVQSLRSEVARLSIA